MPRGGFVPDIAVGEVNSEEDGNRVKNDEEGGKAGVGVGYK